LRPRLAPTAATKGIGSLTEAQARARLSRTPPPGLLPPGAYGSEQETVASFGPGSFPSPRPASIRLRMFS
jgi:hypothetical protein